MNRGFEEVSKAPTTPPSTGSQLIIHKRFVHKVEKGETVSSIAKYESKVSWIINANQIADPTKVLLEKNYLFSKNSND